MRRERREPTEQADQESDLDAAAAAAEAEALEAEARARAAVARAHAFRSQLDAEIPDIDAEAAPEADPMEEGGPDLTKRRNLFRARWWFSTAAAVVFIASGVASGFLFWHHRGAEQQRALTAEFHASARQGVLNLMSIDFREAHANVARLLDSSTGPFKDTLETMVDPLTKSLEQSEVTTTVAVNSTAVESMTADSGVVLVTASTEATDPDGKNRPAQWRISVTLSRDAGDLKMSQVDLIAQ